MGYNAFRRRRGMQYCAPPPGYWGLTIETTGASQAFTVAIISGTSVNITIDWGDGALVDYNTPGDKSHTYSVAGTYHPKITGSIVNGCLGIGGIASVKTRLKATGVVSGITGLVRFTNSFAGCTGLTSVPEDLFKYCPSVSASAAFSGTFKGCTGLTSVPANLFKYNTLVATNGFYDTFNGCTGLTSVPANLFKRNVLVGSYGFCRTFYGCTRLTSLPTDLFRYNTAVSDSGFYQTFYGCTGLTSLPTDLFRYNTAAGDESFSRTFNGCTGLTSLPTDLFRYNTLVGSYGFYRTFYGCTRLTSLPTDLFRYNTAVSDSGFYQTFYGCNKLQLNPWIFYASGEESTRFASPVPAQNFTGCFQLTGAFGGSQGTAPALWDCTFNGAPTTTNCFTGHSAASVDNYGDIPTAWGGA